MSCVHVHAIDVASHAGHVPGCVERAPEAAEPARFQTLQRAARLTLGCCAQVRELIYREILEYHPHMLAGLPAGRAADQLHVPVRSGQLQAAIRAPRRRRAAPRPWPGVLQAAGCRWSQHRPGLPFSLACAWAWVSGMPMLLLGMPRAATALKRCRRFGHRQCGPRGLFCRPSALPARHSSPAPSALCVRAGHLLAAGARARVPERGAAVHAAGRDARPGALLPGSCCPQARGLLVPVQRGPVHT